MVGNLSFSRDLWVCWVVFHCCCELLFKPCVVLVVGLFVQCCWESQVEQTFVLVLGWFFNVSGDRCLSNVLCWFCVVLFSCGVFVCLSKVLWLVAHARFCVICGLVYQAFVFFVQTHFCIRCWLVCQGCCVCLLFVYARLCASVGLTCQCDCVCWFKQCVVLVLSYCSMLL